MALHPYLQSLTLRPFRARSMQRYHKHQEMSPETDLRCHLFLMRWHGISESLHYHRVAIDRHLLALLRHLLHRPLALRMGIRPDLLLPKASTLNISSTMQRGTSVPFHRYPPLEEFLNFLQIDTVSTRLHLDPYIRQQRMSQGLGSK